MCVVVVCLVAVWCMPLPVLVSTLVPFVARAAVRHQDSRASRAAFTATVQNLGLVAAIVIFLRVLGGCLVGHALRMLLSLDEKVATTVAFCRLVGKDVVDRTVDEMLRKRRIFNAACLVADTTTAALLAPSSAEAEETKEPPETPRRDAFTNPPEEDDEEVNLLPNLEKTVDDVFDLMESLWGDDGDIADV